MIPSPTMVGRHVALVPLSIDHVPDLVRAANEDRREYDFTAVPPTTESMEAYVDTLVREHTEGKVVPFAQCVFDASGDIGRAVGCTRYMDIRSPYGRGFPGRPFPDEVEIGGTWLAASVQRTAVNTEAKFMLLSHAFEVWAVQRVAICTDARNARSRTAIARIGASFEGVLRSHRPSYVAGEERVLRDTAVYSVVGSEWPEVKAGLERRLA
jgi:RimJ/RimL family protein N-acetyltransferase